ncbi:MAG: hypothetical protein HXS48_04180 [Theionarchaea archaeon]|nr:MAG: hypothetical protein AYK19_17760 [Theionarchaea archaeon DG-70-1]MBU7026119.1 hypothetical protein [Theionarchaea archaeon]
MRLRLGTIIKGRYRIEHKIYEGGMGIVHDCGDTRAYMINEEEVSQITENYSLVQDLVNRRETTKEARVHPRKNVMTGIAGICKDTKADTFTEYMHEDDFLLLCCDALTDTLTDEEVCETVMTADSQQKTYDILMKKANNRREFHNFSVILTQFGELPKRNDFLLDKIEIRSYYREDFDRTKMYWRESHG